jgi:two-component system cell cycle sensor histidine kinase/response regulator CckA
VEQILMNLVSNARDAIGERGRITVQTGELILDQSVRRGPDEVPPGRYLQLAVCDDGSGMSAQVAARIFEPFFTTKERGRGTGLGLSTVYGLVKGAGGWIHVDSKPGTGTRMSICLPHAESAERSRPIRQDQAERSMR